MRNKTKLSSLYVAILLISSFFISMLGSISPVHANENTVNINNFAVQGGRTIELSSGDTIRLENLSNDFVQLQYNFLNRESAKTSKTNYVSMQPISSAILGCNTTNSPATIGYLLVEPKDAAAYTFTNPDSLPASQVLGIKCLPTPTATPRPTSTPMPSPTVIKTTTTQATRVPTATTTSEPTATIQPTETLAVTPTNTPAPVAVVSESTTNYFWLIIIFIIIIIIVIIITIVITINWKRIIGIFRK